MIYPLTPPLLELLVLSVIGRGDSYGYQISQELKAVSSLKDSALYPVLKRLAENGLVSVYDKQYQGRNRKYYRLTEAGITYHQRLVQEWKAYEGAIWNIIDSVGGVSDE